MRGTPPPDAGDLSTKSGVFLESLSNSSVTSMANAICGAPSDCDVNGAGKQSAVLPGGDIRRLVEYIPGPQRPKMLEGRMRGEERRRLAVAPLGLMPVEDELNVMEKKRSWWIVRRRWRCLPEKLRIYRHL